MPLPTQRSRWRGMLRCSLSRHSLPTTPWQHHLPHPSGALTPAWGCWSAHRFPVSLLLSLSCSQNDQTWLRQLHPAQGRQSCLGWAGTCHPQGCLEAAKVPRRGGQWGGEPRTLRCSQGASADPHLLQPGAKRACSLPFFSFLNSVEISF